MNASSENIVRTMTITNTFYRSESYSEPDYDTAVEFSVSDITDEFYEFQFILGAFRVSLEIECSCWTTSHYYLLPEAGYRQVRNKEKPDTTSSSKHIYATVLSLKSGLEFEVARFDQNKDVIDAVLTGWNQSNKTQGLEILVNPNGLTHLFDALFETYFKRVKSDRLDNLEFDIQ
jgi:hypothetical protein